MTNLQPIASKTLIFYLLGYGVQCRRATLQIREEEEVALTIGSALGVAWAMGYGYDPSAFQT